MDAVIMKAETEAEGQLAWQSQDQLRRKASGLSGGWEFFNE